MNLNVNILQSTKSGQTTLFSVPAGPIGLTTGPDGNVWFTTSSYVGKITPAGIITPFPTSAASSPSDAITKGLDGNLWYEYSSGDGIGKVTPAGTITGYTFTNTSATLNRHLYGIAAGPDGNVWFLETVTMNGAGELEIGKITPSGQITEYPLTGSANPLPNGGGLTTGSDGNLYLTENNDIGQVIPSSSGAPTFNQLQNPNGGTLGQNDEDITKGPDGDIWYTQQSPQAIVKLSIAVTSPTPTPTPTPTSSPTPTPTPVSTPTTTPTLTPTPTPTASAPTGFAPPRINAATELHKRGRIRAIQLLFEPSDPDTLLPSDPLDVADATKVNSYQLLAMFRQKRSRAIVVQPVALASATYTHVTIPASATYGPFEEVTLILGQPIPQSERLQFTAFSSTSAMGGVHGMLVEGNGSGQPGANYVATL